MNVNERRDPEIPKRVPPMEPEAPFINVQSTVTYIGDARVSYHGGSEAKVSRLVWVKPANLPWRLCLHLIYPDGSEDFASLEEAMQRNFLRQPVTPQYPAEFLAAVNKTNSAT